jgi:hypothetical protein
VVDRRIEDGASRSGLTTMLDGVSLDQLRAFIAAVDEGSAGRFDGKDFSRSGEGCNGRGMYRRNAIGVAWTGPREVFGMH